jgi:hypothetical protein
VRGSDPDAALYWFVRMLDGGVDPRYAARRLVRMASEDIGLADPRALRVALDAAETYERLGSPEGELAWPRASSTWRWRRRATPSTPPTRGEGLHQGERTRPVPLRLRNAPTSLMKGLDYGKGLSLRPRRGGRLRRRRALLAGRHRRAARLLRAGAARPRDPHRRAAGRAPRARQPGAQAGFLLGRGRQVGAGIATRIRGAVNPSRMDIFLQQIINGLVLGSVYALVALGYTMVYGIINLINFAHGEVLMVGALTSWTVVTGLAGMGLPGWALLLLSLLAAILVCSVLNFTIEKVAYRPLRNAPRLAPLITAMGMSLLLQTLAMIIWKPNYKAYPILLPASRTRCSAP